MRADQFQKYRNEGKFATFPFLQEYCKFTNTEDSAFPSVYIGLKDKLSGIRRVITDSTVHLIQLLQNYKEKLQDFSKEGEESCLSPGLWYVFSSECEGGQIREFSKPSFGQMGC